jgi:hypothetical protein
MSPCLSESLEPFFSAKLSPPHYFAPTETLLDKVNSRCLCREYRVFTMDKHSAVRSRRLYVKYPNIIVFCVAHTVIPMRLEGELSVLRTVKMPE